MYNLVPLQAYLYHWQCLYLCLILSLISLNILYMAFSFVFLIITVLEVLGGFCETSHS